MEPLQLIKDHLLKHHGFSYNDLTRSGWEEDTTVEEANEIHKAHHDLNQWLQHPYEELVVI